MKPKDIIVGKRYGHKVHMNTIYLGCQNATGKRKFLIIVETHYENPTRIGHTVYYSGKEWYNVKFWESFYKLE